MAFGGGGGVMCYEFFVFSLLVRARCVVCIPSYAPVVPFPLSFHQEINKILFELLQLFHTLCLIGLF